ncbi:MAG: P-loop NTPase [Clostridia bacterium]|nr:P-loop NTPase [Clostridia bacterium]
MGRLIAVTSGKGGAGKSSVSVHLATALAKLSERVLIVDLDAGMRCLDIMLGVSDRLLFDLSDVLDKNKSVQEAVISLGNLDFLPAPLKGKINPTEFSRFISEVLEDYDFIILDFPAGTVDELYTALPRYCEALVVCNADAVSLRDAAIMGADLSELNFMSVRLILNRVSFKNMQKGITANIDEVIDTSGIRLMGVVPQSMDIYMSCCSGQPLGKRTRAAKAFERIAKRVMGYDIPLMPYKKI